MVNIRHAMSLALILVPLQAAAQSSSSNQHQCYSNAGELAPDDIIPCYVDPSAEDTFCCKRGNKCLANNACFDGVTGITYQYGCTDESYQDDSCPSKCGLDTDKSPWVGLVFCGSSTTGGSGTWLCNHPDTCNDRCPNNDAWGSLLQPLPNIQCDDMVSQVALFGNSVLTDIMSLPSDSVGISAYLAEHASTTKVITPTITPTGTAITKSVEESSGTARATSVSPESSSELAAGSNDKVGLAVGFGVGIPVALALAGAVFFLYRRKLRAQSVATVAAEDTRSVDRSPTLVHWHKAELPADAKFIHRIDNTSKWTELEGSTIDGHSAWGSPVDSLSSHLSGRGRASNETWAKTQVYELA